MKTFVDMHTHTYLSNCSHDKTANGETFAKKAAEVGIGILGITNHGWEA